jgi:hypothetical protein
MLKEGWETVFSRMGRKRGTRAQDIVLTGSDTVSAWREVGIW